MVHQQALRVGEVTLRGPRLLFELRASRRGAGATRLGSNDAIDYGIQRLENHVPGGVRGFDSHNQVLCRVRL